MGYVVYCSVTKNSMYQLMQPQMDIIMFEIIFPLLCFNDNDQMLWDEDPHEYVRKGYGDFYYLLSSLFLHVSSTFRLFFYYINLQCCFIYFFLQILLKICIVLEQLPWTL